MKAFVVSMIFAFVNFALLPPLVTAATRYVCGPNGCFAVQTRQAQAPQYNWTANKDSADQADLTENGQAIGSYWFSTGEYHRWIGANQWGRPQSPPIAPPAVPLVKYEGGEFFFGAAKDKRSKREKITIDGVEITEQEAKDYILASQTLEDDSKKKHLTGIGADAATKARFEALFASSGLADVVKDCRVQTYDVSRPVDAAMLAVFNLANDPKFQATHGMLILQDPEKDGRGKAQIIAYGDATPAAMEGALRKADPNWGPQPIPVPVPAPTPLTPATPSGTIPPVVIVGAGIAGILLLAKKKPV